jgi:hypothetical protein
MVEMLRIYSNGILEKVTIEELTPLVHPFDYRLSIPPLDGAGGAKNLKTPDNKNGSL